MTTPMSADPVSAAPGGRTSEEVRRTLVERIGNGQLRPGQRLGAERALAAERRVSRAAPPQALAVPVATAAVRRVPARAGRTSRAKSELQRGRPRIVRVPAPVR